MSRMATTLGAVGLAAASFIAGTQANKPKPEADSQLVHRGISMGTEGLIDYTSDLEARAGKLIIAARSAKAQGKDLDATTLPGFSELEAGMGFRGYTGLSDIPSEYAAPNAVHDFEQGKLQLPKLPPGAGGG
jgi:hypothetical protein